MNTPGNPISDEPQQAPESGRGGPLPRIAVLAAHGAAIGAGLKYGYEFGAQISGPILGIVLAINSALFSTIVVGMAVDFIRRSLDRRAALRQPPGR